MVFKSIGEALPGALLAGLSAAVLAAALKIIPCISRVPFGALAACWPPSTSGCLWVA